MSTESAAMEPQDDRSGPSVPHRGRAEVAGCCAAGLYLGRRQPPTLPRLPLSRLYPSPPACDLVEWDPYDDEGRKDTDDAMLSGMWILMLPTTKIRRRQ